MSRGSGRMSNVWSHSARVSIARVREGLELHSLGGVHFFAESKKVEGSVRADLVLHACNKRLSRVDTAIIDLVEVIYSLYKIMSLNRGQSFAGVVLVQS